MSAITVDVREHALAKALGNAGVSIEPLTVGDVKIAAPDGRYLLLELKTLADMAASVVDGRYASQRSRLLAERQATNCGVAFVLTGTGLGDQRVLGATSSLVARYNIPVLRSQSVDETAQLVRALAQQMAKPPPENAALASTYVAQGSLAHTSRKRNLLEANNTWVAMLSCVLGLSGRTAAAVAEHAFPSAAELLRCDRAEAVRRIAAVTVPPKSVLRNRAKPKSVGTAVAERVVAALNGEPGPPDHPSKKRAGKAAAAGDAPAE